MKGFFFSTVFLVLLCNCTPKYNPHKEYPQFRNQSKQLDHSILAIDVLVVENRKSNPFDYDRQITVAEEFHAEFVDEIKNHDIVLDTTRILSSGIYLNEGSQALMIDSFDESGELIDSGVVMSAPFYLNDRLTKDPLLKEELLLTAVDTVAWEKEVAEGYLPERAIFVVLIEGVNTTVGKQLGQSLLTGLLSLGTVYSYQTSYLIGKLYVFDRDNGRLLWFDTKYYQSDLANGLAARQLARLFVQRFSPVNPYRP